MRAVLLVFMFLGASIVPTGAADHVNDRNIDWACGFGGGHPSQCGIDPVGGDSRVDSEGDPEFKPVSGNDWISDDARVLGITHNGESRAYPVRMLNTHEIVNDVVGGDKLTITFCPLCGSGVSFFREFEYEGQIIETNFTASGYLYRTDMVMWDPETNQLWNQITGKPIAWLDDNEPNGRGHAEYALPFTPTTVTTWGTWKENNPDTLLLQKVPGFTYRENQYAVTDPENCQHGFSGKSGCDVDGVHAKEQVVGYDDEAGGVAFPVRWVAAEPNSTATYTTEEGLELQAIADGGGGAIIIDTATGEPVGTTHMFWFAWQDHYPETEVWLPDDYQTTGPGATSSSSEPGEPTEATGRDGNQNSPTGIIVSIAALALAGYAIIRVSRK